MNITSHAAEPLKPLNSRKEKRHIPSLPGSDPYRFSASIVILYMDANLAKFVACFFVARNTNEAFSLNLPPRNPCQYKRLSQYAHTRVQMAIDRYRRRQREKYVRSGSEEKDHPIAHTSAQHQKRTLSPSNYPTLFSRLTPARAETALWIRRLRHCAPS